MPAYRLLTEEALKAGDAVITVTNHRCIDYGFILRNAGLIVDTRNATASYRSAEDNVLLA
jgi:UDP-N-acetyl-D-glucosamine dehydrogenase